MRTMAELKEIATKMAKRLDVENTGCGMVLLLFDARGRGDRPVAIYLHGINEEEAVKQTTAAMMTVLRAKAEGDSGGPEIVTGPTRIKPVDS
jgi:hypothetical protein